MCSYSVLTVFLQGERRKSKVPPSTLFPSQPTNTRFPHLHTSILLLTTHYYIPTYFAHLLTCTNTHNLHSIHTNTHTFYFLHLFFFSFSFFFTKNLHQHTILSLLTYLTTLSHIACVYYRLLTTHTTHTLTNNYHKTEVVSEKKEKERKRSGCVFIR